MNVFKRLKNSKGFTVLENILTVVVLSIGLMGSMVVMQNAALNTVNGDMNTIATQSANEKLEMIMADKTFQGYDFVTSDNYDSEVLQTYGMSRSVSVTEVSVDDLTTPEENSGLKKVEVSVSWGEESYQVVNVSTLVSDYE